MADLKHHTPYVSHDGIFSHYHRVEQSLRVNEAEKKGMSRYPLLIEFRGLSPGSMQEREIFLDITNRVAPLKSDLKHIYIWGLERKCASSRRSILTNIVRQTSAFTKLIVILPPHHAGHLIYSIKGKNFKHLKF